MRRRPAARSTAPARGTDMRGSGPGIRECGFGQVRAGNRIAQSIQRLHLPEHLGSRPDGGERVRFKRDYGVADLAIRGEGAVRTIQSHPVHLGSRYSRPSDGNYTLLHDRSYNELCAATPENVVLNSYS